MALLSSRVSLTNPTNEFSVDLLGSSESEKMHMVSRRKRVDPEEAVMRESSCKYEMAAQSAFLDRNGDKRHADMESDPGFFR